MTANHLHALPAVTAFGDLLQRHRERLRLSQTALAERLGLTHSAVNRWESGSRNPTRESIGLLSEALRLTAADHDAMLVAAGFAAIHDEPVIGRLASVLADTTIPADVRDGIREMLWQVVRIVPREVAS